MNVLFRTKLLAQEKGDLHEHVAIGNVAVMLFLNNTRRSTIKANKRQYWH